MNTECSTTDLEFDNVGGRRVTARFDGGKLVSDGGWLVLMQVALRIGLFERLAKCFVDYRNPNSALHALGEMLAQRVLGICLGYEDVNDHEELREEPLLGPVVKQLGRERRVKGLPQPRGKGRKRRRGKQWGRGPRQFRRQARLERNRAEQRPLAGKSTLNRLELGQPGSAKCHRNQRIVWVREKLDRLLVAVATMFFPKEPEEVVLDIDATHDPLHGQQEGRHFLKQYCAHCYLPLYVFMGSHLLLARLRTADRAPSHRVEKEVSGVVRRLRKFWPKTRIVLRGDSGFAKPKLLNWCERNGVHYVLGLARNSRLAAMLEEEMAQAREECDREGRAARRFRDFLYRTRESWPRERRVVGKAEALPGKDNPRFVVTSLPAERAGARELYEDIYCARGDMENRIKEQQLCLFASRVSTGTVRANQFRLYLSSFGYVLMNALRLWGLTGTRYERAQCGTIREKFLKIGARVRVTSRRLWVSLTESYPYRSELDRILKNLRSHPPWEPEAA